MAKSRKMLTIRLPEYVAPRNAWRRLIHERFVEAQRHRGVVYGSTDRLEIHVRLYFREPELFIHDVDNRLKDICDALQGRVGGPKRVRPVNPVIPNDNQIWRITAAKCSPPRQSHGLGHVTVRRFGPAR